MKEQTVREVHIHRLQIIATLSLTPTHTYLGVSRIELYETLIQDGMWRTTLSVMVLLLHFTVNCYKPKHLKRKAKQQQVYCNLQDTSKLCFLANIISRQT